MQKLPQKTADIMLLIFLVLFPSISFASQTSAAAYLAGKQAELFILQIYEGDTAKKPNSFLSDHMPAHLWTDHIAPHIADLIKLHPRPLNLSAVLTHQPIQKNVSADYNSSFHQFDIPIEVTGQSATTLQRWLLLISIEVQQARGGKNQWSIRHYKAHLLQSSLLKTHQQIRDEHCLAKRQAN